MDDHGLPKIFSWVPENICKKQKCTNMSARRKAEAAKTVFRPHVFLSGRHWVSRLRRSLECNRCRTELLDTLVRLSTSKPPTPSHLIKKPPSQSIWNTPLHSRSLRSYSLQNLLKFATFSKKIRSLLYIWNNYAALWLPAILFFIPTLSSPVGIQISRFFLRRLTNWYKIGHTNLFLHISVWQIIE